MIQETKDIVNIQINDEHNKEEHNKEEYNKEEYLADPVIRLELGLSNDPPKKSFGERVKLHCDSGINHIKSCFHKLFEYLKKKLFFVELIIVVIFLISLILWFVIPREKTATVKKMEWHRNIPIEEYKTLREESWELPEGAKLIEKKEEIHHYEQNFDHYEEATRQIIYKGTGLFDKGKERYANETYEKPVYVEKAIYKTRYIYDIGKWINIKNLTSQGTDNKPYWEQTDLPSSIPQPKDGDKRQGEKSENYLITFVKESKDEFNYDYNDNEFKDFSVGDKVTYKIHVFSNKPSNKPKLIYKK